MFFPWSNMIIQIYAVWNSYIFFYQERGQSLLELFLNFYRKLQTYTLFMVNRCIMYTLVPGWGRWSRRLTRGRSSYPSLFLHWSLPYVPRSRTSTRRNWGSPGASSSLLLSRCCLVTQYTRVMILTLTTEVCTCSFLFVCLEFFFFFGKWTYFQTSFKPWLSLIQVLIKFYSILIQVSSNILKTLS